MMKIAQRIGKLLRVDHATSTGARLDYARVCVQVDITKPLLLQFKIHGIKYFIQYEGLENICLQCGTYAARGRCACTPPTKMDQETVSPPDPHELAEQMGNPPSQRPPEKEQVYNEWVIAKKKVKARKDTPNGKAGKQPQRGFEHAASDKTGSRFSVLSEEENVDIPRGVNTTDVIGSSGKLKGDNLRQNNQNTKW
ncbi:unnamed protein product [Linum tenue]|nr:unnamed protein product [Linum tenue]